MAVERYVFGAEACPVCDSLIKGALQPSRGLAGVQD